MLRYSAYMSRVSRLSSAMRTKGAVGFVIMQTIVAHVRMTYSGNCERQTFSHLLALARDAWRNDAVGRGCRRADAHGVEGQDIDTRWSGVHCATSGLPTVGLTPAGRHVGSPTTCGASGWGGT